MAIDPTASEFHLFASLRKFFYDLALSASIPVAFDDANPDLTQDRWLNIEFNEPAGVSDSGTVLATIHAAASGSNKEAVISQLRDAVVDWLTPDRDAGETFKTIPIYEFHDDESDPTERGAFFVKSIFPGKKLPGDGGILYRQMTAEIGFFAKV